jgi:hypothetical protein
LTTSLNPFLAFVMRICASTLHPVTILILDSAETSCSRAIKKGGPQAAHGNLQVSEAGPASNPSAEPTSELLSTAAPSAVVALTSEPPAAEQPAIAARPGPTAAVVAAARCDTSAPLAAIAADSSPVVEASAEPADATTAVVVDSRLHSVARLVAGHCCQAAAQETVVAILALVGSSAPVVSVAVCHSDDSPAQVALVVPARSDDSVVLLPAVKAVAHCPDDSPARVASAVPARSDDSVVLFPAA